MSENNFDKEIYETMGMRITKEDKQVYGIEPMPEGVDYQDFETNPENMGNIMRCLGDKFLAAAAILEAKNTPV